MAHGETTLESKELYNGKVIRVTLDTVELENGDTSLREVVHHHGGACVLAVTPENELYMVRQFRYAFGRELCCRPASWRPARTRARPPCASWARSAA